MSGVRVVIYTGGATTPLREQLERCLALCDRAGYQVVATAQDQPGLSQAWEDAQRMIADGVVDRVVFAGPVDLPDYQESVTAPWTVNRPAEGPARQRTAPVRRAAVPLQPVERRPQRMRR